MDTIYNFLALEPLRIKLFFPGLLAVAVFSLARFGRLAVRLYDYRVAPVLREKFAEGGVAPDNLARASLASRVVCGPFLDRSASSDQPSETLHRTRSLRLLKLADCSFRYQWERCNADVESAKRASVLTLILSCAMVTIGAPASYFNFSNFGSKHATESECLLLTLDQLLVTLGLGLCVCAVLYLGAGFFERALAGRLACWKYLCSQLEDDLSGK
jgi:hypothetical protein